MKVFLSWSGGRSHKVALVLRDWLPSVIQEIVPYVSSEDIDKGARWSTDIAKELEDSTFGILCVTRENISAPWLNFEAGSLSKTMDKAFVSPFLFDIKRSEVHGPILQFQSTVFEKEDVNKLINSLNKACEKDRLPPERLSKAFEVWYPTLEKELNALKESPAAEERQPEPALKEAHTQEVLEEILDLTRNNQKLIRNPEGGAIAEQIEETRQLVRGLHERMGRKDYAPPGRWARGSQVMMIEEVLHSASGLADDGTVGVQMTLALVRDEFPWLYDTGMETLKIVRSDAAPDQKRQGLQVFQRIVEFTFEHPIMRTRMEGSKEWHIMRREIPRLLDFGMHMALEHSLRNSDAKGT